MKQNEITVDGIINEPAWEGANSVNNFTLPWEESEVQPTEFKALYDNDRFYFSFFVQDSEMVILDSIETEEDLVEEDRVEIYFAFDGKLAKSYYCVEVDPKVLEPDYHVPSSFGDFVFKE